MERFQRIETADWVENVRFRLRFADGAAGVVELAPELGDEPGVLFIIQERPADVTVAQGGRALLRLTDTGDEVDLDADALRLLLRAEQAAAEQVSSIRLHGAATLSGLATD